MKIIVYSATNSETVDKSLGRPEYSYYFVLKQFTPVLEEIGEVIPVKEPGEEVDQIYDAALAAGDECVFLSFSPPHKTALDLRCPTYPVFAWEFDTIPTEAWESNSRNDWRYVLNRLGVAITHSCYAVEAVQRALGNSFPVVAIPSPAWDRMEETRERCAVLGTNLGVSLGLHGEIIDSSAIAFSKFDPLELQGPNRIENYDYAVSIIRERDAQLQQRNADCAYAESIVQERDVQLAERNKEVAHAESVIRERDAQLVRRNEEFAHAESVVRERDAQLARRNEEFANAETVIRDQKTLIESIQSTVLGRAVMRLALRKAANDGDGAS